MSGGTLRLPVKPVLTWKTRILSLRDFRANQPLGYGATYVTKAPAHVAVLPVGYADGYNRQLSNRGRVIVREHYAPMVGRISMDLTLADVTGIPGCLLYTSYWAYNPLRLDEQANPPIPITRSMFPAGAAGDYTYHLAVNTYAPSFLLREPRKTFRFTVATTF